MEREGPADTEARNKGAVGGIFAVGAREECGKPRLSAPGPDVWTPMSIRPDTGSLRSVWAKHVLDPVQARREEVW